MVDNISYDEDGLPVYSNFVTSQEYHNHHDDGVGDVTRSQLFNEQTEEQKPTDVILRDVFNINSIRYEVTLNDSQITFDPIKSAKRGAIRKLSGLFRVNSSRATPSQESKALLFDGTDKEHIDITNIYGVKVLSKKFNSSQDGDDGRVYGFVIHFAEKKINKWKARAIAVNHSDKDTCQLWTNHIKQIIEGQTWRPRKVKVILQPHSGGNDARFHYKSKIEVLLNAAEVTFDLLDLQNKREVNDDLEDVDLNTDYDCFLCVGGDGTVSKVINFVLNKTQHQAGHALRAGIIPQKPHITIGIVALGMSNQIAMSACGTDDPVTGVLHTILGHKIALDVCSVYSNDELIRWCFAAQYGFSANVLSLSERYNFLGHKKMEAAIVKALTKSKLKAYKCDLEYITGTSGSSSHPNDGVVCYTGCSVCKHQSDEPTRSMVEDLVEELNPLSISNTSSTIMDLTEATEWCSCKADCLNVSLLTLPARSQFAPRGLSKFSHLSDGCLDIILASQSPRKQFVRHLRRHGNNKNQLAFSFIKTYRAKCVRFRPRLPTTWNYRDHDYNEINYEMARVQSRASRASVIDLVSLASSGPLDSDGDDGERENSETESVVNKTPSPKTQSSTHPSPVSDAPVMPKVRLSFTEIEIKKRKERQRKKDEQRRSRDENKSRSLWSLDSELVTQLELDFVVHQGLVLLCGQGVAVDSPYEDNVMRYLPAL